MKKVLALSLPLFSGSILCIGILTLLAACDKDDNLIPNPSSYTGTASVTQGLATTTTSNLYSAGQRVAGLGTITASDNSVCTVPADVNYTDSSFPFAPDLYNPDGIAYTSSSEALSAFDDDEVIVRYTVN